MSIVPNTLTISRIAVTPMVLALLFWDTLTGQGLALVLFVLAAISDYWDGRLARSMGAVSRLGKFLDPMADKVLVLGTFVTLSILLPDVAPWWAVALIGLRDVVVTTLRIRAESQGQTLQTLPLAKTKTTLQLVYLIGVLVLLVARHVPGIVATGAEWVLGSMIPVVLLCIIVALTVYTGAGYLMRSESLRG